MTTKYPCVFIIILNWNGKEDTDECIKSVYNITYPNYKIVIVDNGSTDGSIEYFKKYSDIYLIDNGTNLGFTKGNNIGVKFALNHGADFVLLLNNDTTVNSNFLCEMVAIANKDDNIALIQSKMLCYDDLTINSTGIISDIFGSGVIRGKFEKDNGQYDTFTESNFFYLQGACLLITKKLLYNLKGEIFDENLFTYNEDLDLSWLARLWGYRLIYCPTSICLHKDGRTICKFKSDVIYWTNKNKIRILLKNYSIINVILIVPAALLLQLVFSIYSSLIRKDSIYIRSLIKAVIWNIANIDDTVKMRNIVQSKRTVKDRKIMKFMKLCPLEISLKLKRDFIKK